MPILLSGVWEEAPASRKDSWVLRKGSSSYPYNREKEVSVDPHLLLS